MQTVERCVFESYTALYRTAKVHLHLTSLAQRFATDRLTALTDPHGADLATVRGIGNDLDDRVQVLLRELTGPTLA